MEGVARIVLGLEPPELAEEVMDFLDRSGGARVIGAVSDPGGLSRAVRGLRPDAVIAQPWMARALDGALEGRAFLAVDTGETVSALRDALAAGARGFFVWPDEKDALAEVATRIGPPPGSAATKDAVIVAVHGPRGGAGTTFVASHLAAALARRGAETTLVDCDPLFGDLSPALGADPSARTVADLAPVAAEMTAAHVREALWQHPAGFGVLLAPQDVPSSGAPGPILYTAIIETLRRSSDAVVLHLARALDARALAAAATSSRILLVLTLDVLAFRAAKRTIAMLEGAGLEDRVEIIVNRAARGEIVPADVGRVFGRTPIAVMPVDRGVGAAQDHGRLLPPKGRIGRTFDRLASALLEGAGDETSKAAS